MSRRRYRPRRRCWPKVNCAARSGRMRPPSRSPSSRCTRSCSAAAAARRSAGRRARLRSVAWPCGPCSAACARRNRQRPGPDRVGKADNLLVAFAWVVGAGGAAAVGLPVTWAGEELAGAAQRWFRRIRRTDDLSRLVRAATGTSVDLTRTEFDDVRRLLEDKQTWTVLGRGTDEDLAGLTNPIAASPPPGARARARGR